MGSTVTLRQAVRALDDRRREIEAAILADLEFLLLVDPAPRGALRTTVIGRLDAECGTGNASSARVVTWQE